MFPGSKHRTVRNTQSRRKHTQSRSHRSQKPSKLVRQSETAKLSFADRFRTLLLDIQRLRSRFLSYTVSELEEICEQLAIQQMSASATAVPSSESCVLICHFCQNLIFEPITLSCGHTYCDPCIKDEQISSSVNCPRCPDDIQGQIQSSIISAREKHFSRNHFLMQIFERAEPFKHKYPLIALYYKGKTDFTNGNHQQAVDTLSEIIVQGKECHVHAHHGVSFLNEYLFRSRTSSCVLRASQSIGSFGTVRTSTRWCNTHRGVETSMDKGEISFVWERRPASLC